MYYKFLRTNLGLGLALATAVPALIAAAPQRQSDSRTDRQAAQMQALEPKGDKGFSHKNRSAVYVDCSNPSAKVKTIAAGLSLLGDVRPASLFITGICHENVTISGLDRLTLQGNPTATIDGGTDPNLGTVVISDSQSIELISLTITGSGQGLTCNAQSLCRLTNSTVQSSLGAGVSVAVRSHLQLTDSTIQNNADVGLAILGGSVNFLGGAVTGNGSHGISVANGSFLRLLPGNLTPAVTVQNNSGNGIIATLNDTLVLNTVSITGNIGDGVALQSGSGATLFATAITNNLGHQVRIGDLSFVRFAGFQSNSISGANFPDVVCDPQFSATRQLASNVVGATTNCPAELPSAP